MQRWIAVILMVIAIVFLNGCSTSYVVPAGGVAPASLSKTDWTAVKVRPVAAFPARIAAVRVQAAGYRNSNIQGYGGGQYSVVTTREAEADEDIERLMTMPQVAGMAMLNRLVIPPHLSTDSELRQAAGRLQADMLLLYSFDTTFHIDDHEIGPLGVITLGMLPNQEAKVTSTCSAALFDVKTGYIYGLAEATGAQSELASIWRTRQATDSARLKAEKKAFAALVPELEKLWSGITREYAHRAPGVQYENSRQQNQQTAPR